MPLALYIKRQFLCRWQSLWQLAYISSMRRQRAWLELSLLGEFISDKNGSCSCPIHFFVSFIYLLLLTSILSALQFWSSCNWVVMWLYICPHDSNDSNTPNLDTRTHDFIGSISFLVCCMYFSQVKSQLYCISATKATNCTKNSISMFISTLSHSLLHL